MTPSVTSGVRDPLTSEIIASAIEALLPVIYKGTRIELAYRVDLVVADSVIVEVKAVDKVHPIVDAQVLTYLKLSGLHTALICNFNVGLMKDGIKRLVL